MEDKTLVVKLQSTPRDMLDNTAAKEVRQRRSIISDCHGKGCFVLKPDMKFCVVAGKIALGHHEGLALRDEPDRESTFSGAYAEDGSAVEILEVNPPPGGFVKVRNENKDVGWISMRDLHVQLVGDKFPKLKAGAFVLKRGREMLHGNVLHADGTGMRKLPKNDGGENYNSHHLKDGQAAIVQRTTGENESKEGYEWALVRLKETHQMIGWIKAQNLHVQLN